MLNRTKLAFLLYPLHLLLISTQAYASNEELIALHNPSKDLLHKAKLIKPVQNNKKIDLLVLLEPRNQKQFDQLVNDVYNPNATRYQQFLTKDELENNFEQPKLVKYKVRDYFNNLGMSTKILGNFIIVHATAGQIKQALNTQINWYSYKKRTAYANASAPMIPVSLKPYIKEIGGLNNLITISPLFKKNTEVMHKEPAHDLYFAWDSFIPAAQPTTTSVFNGFTGAQLRTTYQLANVPNVGTQTIDGTGQTVIIIGACGLKTPQDYMTDANLFSTNNKLPLLSSSNFQVLNQSLNTYTSSDCKDTNQGYWDIETALDIQALHTVAPNAKIIVALAQDNSANSFASITAGLNYKLSSNNFAVAGFGNATVVSNSWTWAEYYSTVSLLNYMLSLASASGLSYNYATGDCGDETYSSSACPNKTAGAKVNFPASSPFVTAIGGTSLFVDNSWNYAFETVWGTFKTNAYYYGGGGGLSSLYTLPAWQSTISSYVAGGYGLVGNRRGIPDISMLGDPDTGLRIISGGSGLTQGGTSLGTPLFSGVLALINQSRLLNNKKQIGQAAPYLYQSNSLLRQKNALNLITAPHSIISGASRPPQLNSPYNNPPDSAFTLSGVTFGWNSSLTIDPKNQFWNDAVGVGSPNIPQFVSEMSKM